MVNISPEGTRNLKAHEPLLKRVLDALRYAATSVVPSLSLRRVLICHRIMRTEWLTVACHITIDACIQVAKGRHPKKPGTRGRGESLQKFLAELIDARILYLRLMYPQKPSFLPFPTSYILGWSY